MMKQRLRLAPDPPRRNGFDVTTVLLSVISGYLLGGGACEVLSRPGVANEVSRVDGMCGVAIGLLMLIWLLTGHLWNLWSVTRPLVDWWRHRHDPKPHVRLRLLR